MTRKPHAHPDHDVLFAKAQELNVPIGLHPSLEPTWALRLSVHSYEHVLFELSLLPTPFAML